MRVRFSISDNPSFTFSVGGALVDLGVLEIANVIPYIPSNYGLITYNGVSIRVS